MNFMKLQGIFVPNVTPFDKSGGIIEEAMADLIDYWLDAGVSGLVVNASTGEGPLLSREERQRIIELVLSLVDGRGLVIAGTGAIGTRETVELTRDALDLGADAALVSTPFFFRPTNDELIKHFNELNGAVDLPLIFYNVPKFTGYIVAPSVVDQISKGCNNVVGIKDSSGSPSAMAENIRLFGDRINVLSGSADMTLPTLAMGGKGAILAVANVVPDVCVDLYRATVDGDLKEAGRLQLIISYVNKVVVRERPMVAAVKAVISFRGFNAGIPRRPLRSLSYEEASEVKEALKVLNII